ncbi:MAG: dTMP kinase [Myxococcales bacterium]|nr:dTMP kinase [Myxococcales bacterium]
MIDGLFVVLEGVDGAGTTTHTRLLAKALEGQGLPVHTTREPSDGPVGVLLRQILTGRVVVPGVQGPRAPSWDTMALLFAADRLDHVESEILPNIGDGVTVISDRYDYSSIAYQSLSASDPDDARPWVTSINANARRPDLVIVLDVTPEVAAARRSSRSGPAELYEGAELQAKLVRFYQEIEQYFPEDRVVHVDATRGIDAVAADILAAVRNHRGDK